MMSINFVIPVRPDELISDGYGHYTVKEVLHKEEISKYLKAALQCFRDEGPSYITENFDVYFSVIQLYHELPRSTTYNAYEDLRKALNSLPNIIEFMLEDEDSLTDEGKAQMQTTIKMLTYLFVVTVQTLEGGDQNASDDDLRGKGRGGKKQKKTNSNVNSGYKCKWLDVVTTCKNLLQADLNKFWDAPGADAEYTNLLADVCYLFLADPQVRYEQDTLTEIWNIIGLLLTQYHVDQAIIIRLVRLVKEHEHLSSCLPNGVQYLVNTFNCNSVLDGIVKELTEWQLTDTNVESNASKFCSKLLVEMAIMMPHMMLTKIIYLSIYLKSDSYQLRNMVLAVQVEVLISNLVKVDPTTQERQLRNNILFRLERFTADSSSHVRSKVFQHLARLQVENAIPLRHVNKLLRRAVDFLHDPVAFSRKAAAQCVSTMLKHNSFGPSLSLSKFEKELNLKKMEMVRLKFEIFGLDLEKQEQIEHEWLEHALELKEVVVAQLADAPDDAPEMVNGCSTPLNVDDAIREHIRAKDYVAAVQACQIASKKSASFTELQKRLDTVQESELYLCFMHVVFSNIPRVDAASATTAATQDQLEALPKLETNIDYLSDACEFLKLLHEAMDIMRGEMLNSMSIGDMHEAVDFIITANQFMLEDAVQGILDILRIMMRNEQDRRKIVLDALKTVYLVTDSASLLEHTTQVVERLIKLLQSVSYQQMDSLTTLMAEWSEQGIISNDIFDTMWSYFLQRVEVPAAKSRASLVLLRMTAQGRFSIVEKNYGVVGAVCFRERGLDDLLLAIEGLRFLIVLSSRPVAITSSTAQFRIPATNVIWTDLHALVQRYITHRAPAVNNLLSETVRFVFKLSEEPLKVTQCIVRLFLKRIKKDCPKYMLIRYNLLMGEIAIGQLSYLDSDVYKELKRRQNITHERKNKKNKDKKTPTASKKKSQIGSATARSRKASANITNNTSMNSTVHGNLDDSMMDGAEAVDGDADFISDVLEMRCIANETDLGKLYKPIVTICKRPDVYANELVQSSACTALLRGMLVSSMFCEEHIRLVFTILAKTAHVENKVTIIMHMSDLLEKSPNVVEPYTPKLYELLDDPVLRVREVAMIMISTLILKDMIRPQEHVWKLAHCIADPAPRMAAMAKSFFVHSAQKSNNLYNYLPDIFTHLCGASKDDGQLRSTLQYLFGLIDKAKQIENLVERFCLKYENTTDEQYAKNISYALTLMTYNDRALQKLIENFAKFKHFVLVDEVYANMKLIVAQTLKANMLKKEIKALTVQLEELMEAMFDLNADKRPLQPVENNNFKKPAPKPPRKAKVAARNSLARKKSTPRERRVISSSDSGSDEDEPSSKRSKSVSQRRGAKNQSFK